MATENSSSPLAMTNVTANGSGGWNSNTGMFVHNATLTMTNVTVSASGGVTSTNYGVHNFELSFPTINNSTISASGGSNSYGIYRFRSLCGADSLRIPVSFTAVDFYIRR